MKFHPVTSPRLLGAAALLAAFSTLSLPAADGTWFSSTSGNWSDSAKWPGGIADGAGFTATFTGPTPNTTAPVVIAVDADRTIGNLSFQGPNVAPTGTHNFTLGGSGTLTLAGGSTPTITVNLVSRNVIISAILAGNQGISFTGTSGTITLSGANTYTGLTQLSGAFIVNNNKAFGSTTGATTFVNSSTYVVLNNGIKVTGETLATRGNGGSSPAGALQTANNASAEWAGAIRLNNGSSRFGAVGLTSVLTLSGVISDGTTNDVASVGSVVFGSNTSSTGTVVISAANNYTGTTQVIRGTAKLDAGNNRLPTGTALDIWGAANGDNAVLNLNGYNQTVASLTRSGVVTGATSTLTNDSVTESIFTVNGTASTTYAGNITGNLALVKAGSSTLNLTGTANTFTGNITVNGGTLGISSAFINDTADVSIANGAVFALNFDATDTIAGLYLNGIAQALGTYGSLASDATFKSAFFTGDGILNVTEFAAVPEPSAFALLLGAGTLAAVALRRRR